MDTSRAYAQHLDAQDPLAAYRQRFYFAADTADTGGADGLIYMDGNSLGRLPLETLQRVSQVVEQQWGQDLIRSWGRGWFDASVKVGDKIAGLLGAGPGQVAVSDSTTVNLYKLAMAALALRPGRTGIVTDAFNFPSDHYVLQGIVAHWGAPLGRRHTIQVLRSQDGLTIPTQAVCAAIDENTALVTLSHVVFKSGYLYDAAAITAHAHQMGALVLWDLSHSAGAVPLALDEWGVDFAVGCTYKYLNGGPGAPAFLYVRKDLQGQALSPIWGWFGDARPFAFDLEYAPAPDIRRFICGTSPILSLLALESGVDLLAEVGIGPLRQKSIALTGYLIDLVDARLGAYGFTLGTPRRPEQRGSHVSIRHPEGYRINRALIDEMNVLPDFREPDNLRLGLAPIYTTYVEVWECVERIRVVMEQQRYLKYDAARTTVT